MENNGLEPRSGVLEVSQGYEDELSAQLDTVIGETAVPLDAQESVVREGEPNLGNYITDALRARGGTDVTIQNGGGIRTDTLCPEGNVTKRLVYSSSPFGNNLVTVEESGATLTETIEHSVSQVGDGGFLQVSGMNYTYDPDGSQSDSVAEITVEGEQVDLEATYTMATNNFTTKGGDSYTML